MSRDLKTFLLRLAAISGAACSSVYAAHSAPTQPIAVAAPAARPIAQTPYQVELRGEDDRVLETYPRGGRFYVLGQAGEHYSVRVVNPTARRVEAVVSVDGLDVVDGEGADFVHKRGYVVPPYGDVTIHGFRTSTTNVASFRFSSVSDSYADRKGKGRNVGVVGVAIFEERAQPQVIVPEPMPPDDEDMREEAPPPPMGGYGAGAGAGGGGRTPAHGGAKTAAAPAETAPAPGAPAPARGDAPSKRVATADQAGVMGGANGGEMCCGQRPPTSRPGLGTSWGEDRYSAVEFTQFERANQTVPSAIAELRYNDVDGLRALGILIRPTPDQDEIMRRETADPFPESHFAAPPP